MSVAYWTPELGTVSACNAAGTLWFFKGKVVLSQAQDWFKKDTYALKKESRNPLSGGYGKSA